MTAQPDVPTPPNVPTIGLDDAISQMQTGDIVIFHCDALESEVIDLVTDSWFSHAAMVYRDPVADGVYIWQTDPGIIVADEMGKLSQWGAPRAGNDHAGAQLGVLRDAVIETSKTWGDQPYWRQLSFPRTPLWNTQVLSAMFKLDGSDYPGDAEMLLTYLLGRQGIANATKDMFCSEMIAATCMMVGLLQEVHPPNFYAPRDFSSEPNATLPLVPAATLATELKVVLPPD